MKLGFVRFVLPIAGAAFLVVSTAAWAQGKKPEQSGPQDYDAGKTPAQLFASDCGICHKSPQGLAKANGPFGLESFLREHYTSSRQSAAALARYLAAVGEGAKPPARAAVKRAPKPKPADAKPGDAKPGEAKSGEAKPDETKSGDAKPAEAKPAEAGAKQKSTGKKKPEADKASDTSPPAAESKSGDAKPVGATEGKPAAKKPAKKKSANSKPDKTN